MRFLICLFSLLITVPFFAESKLPADMTFLVADLKYNEKDGVKICEIQTLNLSTLSGYDFTENRNGISASLFFAKLSEFFKKGWFVESNIADGRMKDILRNNDFKPFKSFHEITSSKSFKQSSFPVKNPENLHSYSGAIYMRPLIDNYKSPPGILTIDAAFFPYIGFVGDKLAVAQLMDEKPSIAKLRPKWESYPKKYSEELVQKIKNGFSSDKVVIKPIGSCKGQGVIIVEKESIGQTLKYIFERSPKLRNEKDLSYRHWLYDKHRFFIVEEYFPSDPVSAPHLGSLLFDGTMRVAFVLRCHNESLEFDPIAVYWKLPKASLNEGSSLNDCHKSFGEIPYFLKVDPKTKAAVLKSLKEGMLELYKLILEK